MGVVKETSWVSYGIPWLVLLHSIPPEGSVPVATVFCKVFYRRQRTIWTAAITSVTKDNLLAEDTCFPVPKKGTKIGCPVAIVKQAF